VAGLALDLVDTLDLEASALHTALAASFGTSPSSAMASQAWASISNRSGTFSGSKCGPFRGGCSAGSWVSSGAVAAALSRYSPIGRAVLGSRPAKDGSKKE